MVRALYFWGLLAVTASALLGCDDFAPPSELTEWQVVGVVAEPPVVAPGATTTLTPLLATPQGPVTGVPSGASVSWAMIETLPGVAPFGTVTARADGRADYAAPATVPTLPPNAQPLDSMRLQLSLDGKQVSVVKSVLVATAGSANPTITGLTAGGVAVGDTLHVAVGTTLDLQVAASPAPSERTRYAWYASIGELERYQSNPSQLTIEQPGEGWLYVVVRDGQLGVAWRAVPLVAR